MHSAVRSGFINDRAPSVITDSMHDNRLPPQRNEIKDQPFDNRHRRFRPDRLDGLMDLLARIRERRGCGIFDPGMFTPGHDRCGAKEKDGEGGYDHQPE